MHTGTRKKNSFLPVSLQYPLLTRLSIMAAGKTEMFTETSYITTEWQCRELGTKRREKLRRDRSGVTSWNRHPAPCFLAWFFPSLLPPPPVLPINTIEEQMAVVEIVTKSN